MLLLGENKLRVPNENVKTEPNPRTAYSRYQQRNDDDEELVKVIHQGPALVMDDPSFITDPVLGTDT